MTEALAKQRATAAALKEAGVPSWRPDSTAQGDNDVLRCDIACDLNGIGAVWLAERLAAMTDHEVTRMVIDAYMSGNTIPAREALLRSLAPTPSESAGRET